MGIYGQALRTPKLKLQKVAGIGLVVVPCQFTQLLADANRLSWFHYNVLQIFVDGGPFPMLNPNLSRFHGVSGKHFLDCSIPGSVDGIAPGPVDMNAIDAAVVHT